MKDFSFSPGCQSLYHTLLLTPLAHYVIFLVPEIVWVCGPDEGVEVGGLWLIRETAPDGLV